MDPIELSADAGLVALCAVTVNICLGLLMAVRYSPQQRWPHRHFDLFRLHRWTAYLAIALTLAHPIILLFSTRVRFRLLDIVLPIWSPQQPVENTIGAVGLYLLLLVLITSLVRLNMRRQIWKRFHYLVYPSALALLVHGLLTDPELRTGKVDWLDGEKVLVEVCVALIIAASLAALFYRRRKDAAERKLGLGKYHLHSQVGPSH
jgi:predicted ferric reductase